MPATVTNGQIPPRMIDVREVATILDISTRSVWRLVSRGELPQPIRFGRNVRWRTSDIDSWIESQFNTANNNGTLRRRIH